MIRAGRAGWGSDRAELGADRAEFESRRAILRFLVASAACGTSAGAFLVDPAIAAESEEHTITVDRAVVRFSAPEGGGRKRPYFVYERELAFEARLVARADPAHRAKSEPYRRHHLQAALERHIAETLLAALTIDPAPSPTQIADQLAAARTMVVDAVGGEATLSLAAREEGLGSLELRRFFRRRALASLYLNVMVEPMLEPSALELRRVHERGEGPLADKSFSEAEPALRRWYVAQSLRAAVQTYYQNARTRLRVDFL